MPLPAVIRNHLWPALFGAASAAVTGIATGVPAALEDGLQRGDLHTLAAAGIAAGLGYAATCFNRYAGKDAPWTQPPK